MQRGISFKFLLPDAIPGDYPKGCRGIGAVLGIDKIKSLSNQSGFLSPGDEHG
jgi:hypothetical protein